MNTPLVSIIIPTYNRAHLIGETLDSIIAQSYNNWECIVVDDGSSDDTFQVVTDYLVRDSRIQYVQRPNGYLAGGNGARNYGMELAKGEYIQWFDSDDMMHPDKLKVKTDLALSHKADIIISRHTVDGEFQNAIVPEPEIWVGSDFYVDYILGKRPVITDDVMVKSSIIGERRFDEELRKAQEYEFFGRLFEQQLTYCFVDIVLVKHRETESSISSTDRKGVRRNSESLIYLSEVLMTRHQENELILKHAQRQVRKTYKVLITNKMLDLILKNYSLFKKVHHKSSFVFGLFILYNLLTGRGFDRIKP